MTEIERDFHSALMSLEGATSDLDAITTLLWDMIGEAKVSSEQFTLDNARHDAAVWLIGQLRVTHRELDQGVIAAYEMRKAERSAA